MYDSVVGTAQMGTLWRGAVIDEYLADLKRGRPNAGLHIRRGSSEKIKAVSKPDMFQG